MKNNFPFTIALIYQLIFLTNRNYNILLEKEGKSCVSNQYWTESLPLFKILEQVHLTRNSGGFRFGYALVAIIEYTSQHDII